MICFRARNLEWHAVMWDTHWRLCDCRSLQWSSRSVRWATNHQLLSAMLQKHQTSALVCRIQTLPLNVCPHWESVHTPAVFDHLMQVKLKGWQQDDVQRLRRRPRTQKHGHARLQHKHTVRVTCGADSWSLFRVTSIKSGQISWLTVKIRFRMTNGQNQVQIMLTVKIRFRYHD